MDVENSSRFVVHLLIRQKLLRNTFAVLFDIVISHQKKILGDKDSFAKALGIDSAKPGKIISEILDEHYVTHEKNLKKLGISRTEFDKIILPVLHDNFAYIYNYRVKPLALPILGLLGNRTHEMAEKGHRAVLNQDLTPEARVNALKRLQWSVRYLSNVELVLPDCVAISCQLRDGKFRPAVYAEKGEASTIYLPVDHRRILVGEVGKQEVEIPENINELLASCSWDFFVARSKSEEFQSLSTLIRTRLSEIRLELTEGLRSSY